MRAWFIRYTHRSASSTRREAMQTGGLSISLASARRALLRRSGTPGFPAELGPGEPDFVGESERFHVLLAGGGAHAACLLERTRRASTVGSIRRSLSWLAWWATSPGGLPGKCSAGEEASSCSITMTGPGVCPPGGVKGGVFFPSTSTSTSAGVTSGCTADRALRCRYVALR